MSSAFLAAAVFMLGGCFGVEKTNEHLASMDSSTAQLNKNFEADQKYIRETSEQLALMQKHMELLHKELELDREYLKSVTESLREMSVAIQALRQMGDTALAAVLAMLAGKTEDACVPDINDDTPCPGTTPRAAVR